MTGPPFCVMAKGSKLSSRNTSYDSCDDDLLNGKLDDHMKQSYSKLAPLAKKEQKLLISKKIYWSKDGKESTLTNKHKILHSKV